MSEKYDGIKMQKFGVEIECTGLMRSSAAKFGGDELKKAVKDDNYQIAVTGIRSETSNVTDTLEFFTSGSSKNIFNYSDAEYDKLYELLKHDRIE